ncbi:MAG: hypothetical protein WA317_20800 [Mycobacterium sp.]|uniref:hypothetical protein n=1 Tax=Mycobacterium sp. TaxID=1785 RepID=UPI003CC632BF
MTTHDRQTEMTGSYDESQSGVAETPPVSRHTAPAGQADPPTASTEPPLPPSAASPAVGQEQNQRSSWVAPADASTGSETPSGGSAPGAEAAVSGEAVPAEQSSAEPEPSTEEALFADDELAGLRARWSGVQAAFVDDPKECVQKADVLVSDLVDQLTTGFARARSRLEEQWARGEQASTEDLRLALMHYREFFERLLAV